jgi:hypothetical protein
LHNNLCGVAGIYIDNNGDLNTGGEFDKPFITTSFDP